MLIYTYQSRILSWRLFFFARCQISQQSECSSVCASMNSVSFLGLCWCFSLRLLFCFPFHHIDSFKGNRRGRGAVAASRCSFSVTASVLVPVCVHTRRAVCGENVFMSPLQRPLSDIKQSWTRVGGRSAPWTRHYPDRGGGEGGHLVVAFTIPQVCRRSSELSS